MNTIWILIMIVGPGAGRQIGPFASFEQCEQARYEYNIVWNGNVSKGKASVCVQAAAINPLTK